MTDESTLAAAREENARSLGAESVMAPAQSSIPVRMEAEDSKPTDTDWRTGLPDSIRRVAQKFDSPADVLKSYASLERRLGRSIAIPDAGASAEEIESFYARLGRPETPDGYDIRIPDDLPDHLRPTANVEHDPAGFLAAMHAAGATPGVVQAAVDWYYAALANADAETHQARESARSEAEKSLRTDWGTAYSRNLELARRAARRYGGDELIARLEQAGLADDPVCLRAFHAIGATLSEDGLLSGDSAPAGNAQQRIDRIMKEHFGRPSYAGPEVQDELRHLYQAVYGEASTRNASS